MTGNSSKPIIHITTLILDANLRRFSGEHDVG